MSCVPSASGFDWRVFNPSKGIAMLVLNVRDGESLFIDDLEIKVHTDPGAAVLIVDAPLNNPVAEKKPIITVKRKFRLHRSAVGSGLRALLSRQAGLGGA